MPQSVSSGSNRLSLDKTDNAPSSSRPHSWETGDAAQPGAGDTAQPGKVRQPSQSNLEEIDGKLNHLAKRMQNFENQLCDTVDKILLLLGQKPTMPREKVPELVRPPTTHSIRRGPRLVKSPNDLARLLDKM
ncbi:uncharacterized protein LOC128557118 [Mercenaria mercenaria]|uniref:uncharacterized protein LOC128557118 n=1 Tax=Mercenaria mercenaria TaxID=6596 RepID=UPI00234E6959|nr:uncharacterized protein LOC128557118 [Mercenaria mercenaria]